MDTLQQNQPIKCPRCRRVVFVPSASVDQRAAPPLPAAPLDWQPPATRRASPPPAAPAPPSAIARDAVDDAGAGAVRVPRGIIYCQGVLLGSVGLLFFVFGLLVGSHSRSDPEGAAGAPVIVSGTIRYLNAAQQAVPDESSCVLLLPVATRPDQKAASEGLRPRDAEPDEANPSVAAIRAIGGDVVRVDRRGRFRLRGATQGRYFLLVVSRHVRRRNGESPQPRDLAELGRYVVPVTNLLENQQYLWREFPLRADLHFDHTF